MDWLRSEDLKEENVVATSNFIIPPRTIIRIDLNCSADALETCNDQKYGQERDKRARS